MISVANQEDKKSPHVQNQQIAIYVNFQLQYTDYDAYLVIEKFYSILAYVFLILNLNFRIKL